MSFIPIAPLVVSTFYEIIKTCIDNNFDKPSRRTLPSGFAPGGWGLDSCMDQRAGCSTGTML